MNDNHNETDLELIEDEIIDSDETDAVAEEEVAPKVEKDENGKTEIVGIRFKKNGKTYYFAPNGFTLQDDDRVIVDTARGQEYGYTAVTNREIKNSEICEPLRSVIRLATSEDTKIHEENVKKEIEAFNACIILIDKHKLGMKLIDAELSFDRSKLLFYFSAEGRVDFRELVKDLAGTFHTRIEMRQIGIRDEAKILGGLGICGRPYCCNTFLSDFGQVSVKMAKEQNLSLNSAKISGSCGRLMCCLRYEYDTYLQEKALTPKVDSRVVTPNGPGVVIAANPLAGIVKVRLDSSAEDADAVMFVREDVVDESKYAGETLVKTEIRDRKQKDDVIPSFGSFSGSSEPMPVTVPEPEKVETDEPVTENTAQESPESSDGERKGGHRHRHGRHSGDKGRNGDRHQNDQKPQQSQGEQKPARNDEGDDGKPQKERSEERHNGKPHHKKHGRRGDHGNHGEQGGQNANNGQGGNGGQGGQQASQPQGKPQQKQNAPVGAPSAEGDKPQKKKKKFFKPYFKHGKGGKKPEAERQNNLSITLL